MREALTECMEKFPPVKNSDSTFFFYPPYSIKCRNFFCSKINYHITTYNFTNSGNVTASSQLVADIADINGNNHYCDKIQFPQKNFRVRLIYIQFDINATDTGT
jgi:hypothetical protein